jgi:hypothetical protein
VLGPLILARQCRRARHLAPSGGRNAPDVPSHHFGADGGIAGVVACRRLTGQLVFWTKYVDMRKN